MMVMLFHFISCNSKRALDFEADRTLIREKR